MNSNGAFVADEVAGEHDEKYMPPEVAAFAQENKGEHRLNGQRADNIAREYRDGQPELGVFHSFWHSLLSLSAGILRSHGAWRGKPVGMAVARRFAVTGQFVFVIYGLRLPRIFPSSIAIPRLYVARNYFPSCFASTSSATKAPFEFIVPGQ